MAPQDPSAPSDETSADRPVPGSEGERWLGILQPVFLPWLGYFDQMARVDHFVFQDDVQYTRHDWRNRNRIRTANGPTWLTVPVHARRDDTINEVAIDRGRDWLTKHVRTLRQAYARAPYTEQVVQDYAAIAGSGVDRLVDLTIPMVHWIAEGLGATTPTSCASDVPGSTGADLNERILEIARYHDATGLYLGAKAAEYVPPAFYRPYGITVVFQDYEHPVYPQVHGGFEPFMSAVDLLVNVPPDEIADIVGWAS